MLIAHVPCSGGSFITRYIAHRIGSGMPILSEINPYGSSSFVGNHKPFVPCDPLFHAMANGLLEDDVWLEEFDRRMKIYLDACMRNNKELVLIRDHIFSEFFFGESPAMPHLLCFLQNLVDDLEIIFSVRHPIDSYLGLRISFPEHRSFDFDSYCRKYITALQAWGYTEQRTLRLKLEDLGSDATEAALAALSRRVGFGGELAPRQSLKRCRSAVSGSSGRYSEDPVVPPRRPFTESLRTEFLESSYYKQLCQILSYDCGIAQLSTIQAGILGNLNTILSKQQCRSGLIRYTCDKVGFPRIVD